MTLRGHTCRSVNSGLPINNMGSYIFRYRLIRIFGLFSFVSLLLLVVCTINPIYLVPPESEAATKSASPSSLNFAFVNSRNTASVNLTVSSPSGTFATSTDAQKAYFKINTNNATGYTLKLKTTGSTTTLANGSNSISAISTNGITSNNFSTNTWGLIPSKYNGSANTTKYYKADSTGFTMDTTSAANTTDNEYKVGIGVKADFSKPAGTYTNSTLVAEYVANAVSYAIYYYSNTTATVTGMPSTNPQTGTITAGTTSTSVNLASAPTRTGYTFIGWCLGASGTAANYTGKQFATSVSNVTVNSGSADTCNGTFYDAGQSFGINATGTSPDTYYLYALWEGKSYTATIYYNNKTSSGTPGATPSITSDNTAHCKVSSVDGDSCTVTIPSVVTSSVGQYNNAYAGVASSTGTMTTVNNGTDLLLSDDGDYYAVYRSNVAVVTPTSTSASSSTTRYRNQWFTSKTAMSNSVLASSTTGTSNYTQTTTVATYYSFADRFASAASTNTAATTCYSSGTTAANCTSVASLGRSSSSTFYAVYSRSLSVSFYYINNDTDNSYKSDAALGVMSVSAIQYLRPTSSSAAGYGNTSVSIPQKVTDSFGSHGENYLNVGTSGSNMTPVTSPSTASTIYYARYSDSGIKIYKPATANSGITSTNYYRNQRVISTTAMSDAVLATTSTGTANFSYTANVSGYSLCGFNTTVNNSACTYTSVADAAKAGVYYDTLYAIESGTETATFYYNNRTASGCTAGTSSVTSATSTGIRKYYLVTTSSIGIEQGPIEIPSAVYSSAGTYCNAYVGVNTTGGMRSSGSGSVSPTTANLKYYAYYRTGVTNYYYNGSAYTSRTLRRNQYVTSDTTPVMSDTWLATTTDGTSNYTTATGPGSSVWTGLTTSSTTTDLTPTYTTVAGAATSTATSLYTIYTFNVTYAKGTNTSAIGNTSGSCKVRATGASAGGTSCTTATPSITPSTGYASNGWSTTKDSSTAGTTAGSNITLSTNGTTYYGNVKPASYTVTLNSCSATNTPSASTTATYLATTLGAITVPTRSYTISGWTVPSGNNADGATVNGGTAPGTLTSTYTFNGWYSGTACNSLSSKVASSAATPALSASVSGYTDANSKWTKTSDATLYASWTSQAKTLPTITKTGYTCGWTTTATGATSITYASGGSLTPSANTTLYGVCVGNTYTATIYYNNKTSNGTVGATPSIASTTAQCTVSNSAGNCNANIPNDVLNSVGTYNNTYKNLASTTGTMDKAFNDNGATITLSANGTYYATYSTPVTLYYPYYNNTTLARDITSLNRNQWFTSTSAMSNTVLSTSITGTDSTTNYSPTSPITDYTIYGYNVAPSINTYSTTCGSAGTSNCTSISAIATSATTTWYMTVRRNYYARFCYNNNTTPTVGTSSVTSTAISRYRYIRVTDTAADIGYLSYQNTPTGHYGTYNNAFVGWSVGPSMTTLGSADVNNYYGNPGSDPGASACTFYAVYRTNVTVVTPSSTSAASTATRYRNQYVSSASALSTTVLASSATDTSNYTQTATVATDYSFAGFANAASTNTITYAAVSNLAASTATKAWAVYSKSVPATFYYNNNTTDNTYKAADVKSTTASATQFLRPTSDSAAGLGESNIEIPTVVTESFGVHGENYLNVGTSTSNMTAVDPTTASTTYYARYSERDSSNNANITVYKPASTSTITSTKYFRNQRVNGTSSTSMSDAVLATTSTGTSNFTYSASISGYSLCGFTTTVNSSTCTYTTVANAGKADVYYTTLYAIESGSETAMFYYNNNTNDIPTGSTTPKLGIASIATAVGYGTRKYYPASTSTIGIDQGTVSVPSAVSASKGTHGENYLNVGANNAMSSQSPVTGGTYYAHYSDKVTIYKPASTSTITSEAYYRNQRVSSTSAVTTVIATSNTGASNFTYSAGISGYSLCGFSTTTDGACTYATVDIATDGDVYTELYATESGTETVTFYYSNKTASGCAAGAPDVPVTSTTASGTRKYYPASTSEMGVIEGSIAIPAAVTGSAGTFCNAYAGINNTGGMRSTGSGSLSSTTANSKYYAYYRTAVTNYYYNTSTPAYTSRTLYRNQYVTSDATPVMSTTRLATTTAGTSNYSTAAGPGSSGFFGYATALNSTSRASNCYSSATPATSASTTACSSVARAAYSTNTTLNTIYQFTVTYDTTLTTGVCSIGTATGSGISYGFVSSTSASAGGTSVSVTTPTITACTGYSSLGWGAQGHTTAGTTGGNTYVITTSGETLYATAKINTYSLAITFAGTGVSNVKVCTVAGDCSGSNLKGTVSTSGGSVTGLTYNQAYYLYPTFQSDYELDSWDKTSSTGTLSSTSDANPTFTMGAGNGAVTIIGKSSKIYMWDATIYDCGASLWDNRDGTERQYTTAMINDLCWMTTNLDLGIDGSSTGSIMLTPDTTNITSNFYLAQTDNTDSWGYITSDPPYVYHSNSTDCSSSSGCYSYYTFYAATAGWGDSNTTSGNSPRDICPKGWRLPKYTELTDLSNTYSTATALTSSPFSAVYAGSYSGLGLYNSNNVSGYLWSSTASKTSQDIPAAGILWYYSPNNTVSLSPNSSPHSGYSIRCVKASYGYIQDQDGDSLANLMPNEGDTVVLTDRRDENEYHIGKLADGNYWMLDNLKLNVYDVSLENLYGNTNASNTELGYLKNGGGTASDKYAIHEFYPAIYWYNWYYRPEAAYSQKDVVSGLGETGLYYNYCAASAGTYCYGSAADNSDYGSPSGDASSDICPSGWRLPTGGTNGEYNNLYGSYSSVGDFYNAFHGTTTGVYSTANSITITGEGTYSEYWTSSKYTTDQYMRAMYLRSNYYMDTAISRTVGASIRCISTASTPYMQDQNVSTLNALMPNNGDTVTMMDKRDNNKYSITKINGKYWMTTNLNLAGGTTLYADTTNINSDYEGYVLPPSSTTGFNNNNNDYVYNSGSTTCASSSPCYSYYSFGLATVGSSPTSGGNAGFDICPKGWRLPTSAEFTTLQSSYPIGTSLTSNPFYAVYSGYYLDSTFDYGGSAGYYWSSTSSSASNAYRFRFDSSSSNIATTQPRRNGYPVRCVARDDFMQGQTSEFLSEKIPNDGDTISLHDYRDYKLYSITKINGQYWMTTNLNLAGGTTLTSKDSNLTLSFTLPASSTSGFTSYAEPYVYNSGNTTCGSGVACYSYYSFQAATAGTGSSATYTDTTSSICPKGWKLPSRSDFNNLTSIYTTNTAMAASPFYGAYSGYYDNNGIHSDGASGYYWSSAPYATFQSSGGGSWWVNHHMSYRLKYDSTSVLVSTSSGDAQGLAVRCVIGS